MEIIILAGDAGATKTELALIGFSSGKFRFLKSEKYISSDFNSISGIIKTFLNSAELMPAAACIGVPGPVKEGKVISTNIPWEIDEKIISEVHKISCFKVVNDLEAIATAIPETENKFLTRIYKGKEAKKNGNKMIIAPGTGLGQAILVYAGDGYNVISTEGGHADFAPVTDIEIDLLKYLKTKFGHVSIERVISGIGIQNIYEFLLTRDEFKNSVNYFEQKEIRDIPAKISEEALKGNSSICSKTIEIFVSALGELCGSKVLSTNAKGGVYLCGGIPPKIIRKLTGGTFARSYLNKGRLSYFVEPVPVYVVSDESAGIRGAAVIALKNYLDKD
ncbi:MAG: glucokinase [Bacteroidetes bacterium]|nr:glucokinase [Bacteroidota bacterium]